MGGLLLAGRILGGPGPRVDHPDGRYVVLLGLHTDTPAHPNEQARDLIGLLAPTIAVALEPDARAEDDFRGRCSHSH